MVGAADRKVHPLLSLIGGSTCSVQGGYCLSDACDSQHVSCHAGLGTGHGLLGCKSSIRAAEQV